MKLNVYVDGSNSYNHGCADWATGTWIDGKLTIEEASSCSSCWQVGHNNDHVFAEIGDVWDVDAKHLGKDDDGNWFVADSYFFSLAEPPNIIGKEKHI